ncbi:PAAR motif-containing protein [Burkholderia sp. 8Y]|uniref:PAAR domain-containing protein n=1 Tax=Burkholderia sp. 8Y TaxID=2653133 RepID=UPI0012F16EAC|nr:PAAR domain-containing protein [Burkholderia sp. 8Y]VXC56474.1 PAAR motif-containing protein [Burkholderia sp. 8Y]
MMRRMAVVGDKLNNGGEICRQSGMTFTMGDGGHQAALIDGAAYCPVCKTTGFITRVGGLRRMTLGNGEIALDRDAVICGCPEHPHIVAKLAGEAWYDDLAEILGTIRSEKAAGIDSASMKKGPFDECVHALNVPEGYPYLILKADGQITCGRTDSTCRLPRIYTEDAEPYEIHWGDEALSHKDWK